MTTFFTADHHFYHANIIRYCNRPFKNTSHMNEIMIERWNEVVRNGDDVYYLGDFCMGDRAEQIVERLKGTIHFLEGSHDKWMRRAITRYAGDVWRKHEFLPPLHVLKVSAFRGGFGEKIVLCHYAMRSWPHSFHGSLQLYGHSHGRLEATRLPRQMDVGVDCHGFYPVALSTVRAALANDPAPLD